VFTRHGTGAGSEVEIVLINDGDLNAFATRGRIMGLNTGLILKTRSPMNCWA
jgi:predicted Zn-dependent protease